MNQNLFYSLDEPFKVQDKRKKEFVAVRMEADLFKQLSLKAQQEASDLSSVIRKLCRSGLEI